LALFLALKGKNRENDVKGGWGHLNLGKKKKTRQERENAGTGVRRWRMNQYRAFARKRTTSKGPRSISGGNQ